MLWFFIVVIAVLAYLYAQGVKEKKEILDEHSFTAPVISAPAQTASPPEEIKESFAAVSTGTFELVDYLKPTLRTDTGDVLYGSNKMVVWDSARVNTLRRKFQVQNVLQRLEFVAGGNVIEVYRAVNNTGLDTYVFPHEGDDDYAIQIETQKTSDDPSETKSTHKILMDKMNVFLSDESMVPPALIPMIRNLEASYKTRQASAGPKAVDTHRS